MTGLTLAIFELGQRVQQYLTIVALCSERLFVLMVLFPPTSDKVIEGRLRTSIVILWSGFIAYGQRDLAATLGHTEILAFGIKEAVIGVVLGFSASSIFWAAESVGTYVDDLTGFNQIQLMNPSQGQETTLTSTLLSQFAIAAFWLLGGMNFLLGMVYESYRWWPIDKITPLPGALLETFVMHQTDSLMQLVAKLATPFMMVLLLIDLGFSLTGKVSQKLNLTSMGQPVKGVITILMLALLAGVFVDQIRGQLALTDISVQVRSVVAGKP